MCESSQDILTVNTEAENIGGYLKVFYHWIKEVKIFWCKCAYKWTHEEAPVSQQKCLNLGKAETKYMKTGLEEETFAYIPIYNFRYSNCMFIQSNKNI